MNDLASLCMRLAAWLMRDQDSDWANAMRAELEHVPKGNRLSWGIGCLFSAVQWRFESMRTGTLKVSRGILLIELLACFLPITLGWWDAAFGGSGLLKLNASVIQEHFLGQPLGTGILAMMAGGAVVGLVGPIGLFLSSRAVITGAGLRNRALGFAMMTGVAAFAVASIALRLLAGPGAYAATPSFIFLVCVLPAIGIAHLMYLGGASPVDRDWRPVGDAAKAMS